MSTTEELPKYKNTQPVYAFKIGKIEGLTLHSECGEFSVDVDTAYIDINPLNMEGYFIRGPNYDGFKLKLAFEREFKMISVGDLDVVDICESCSKPILTDQSHMIDAQNIYFHTNGVCDAWTKEDE